MRIDWIELKAQCKTVLDADDTKYIATSFDAKFTAVNITGCSNLGQIIDVLLNPISFGAVNVGDATMVAECKFDGYRYEIYYKYYIHDYYDFDPRNSMVAELYALDTFGLANNYLSIGKLAGYATFTVDNDNIIYTINPINGF